MLKLKRKIDERVARFFIITIAHHGNSFLLTRRKRANVMSFVTSSRMEIGFHCFRGLFDLCRAAIPLTCGLNSDGGGGGLCTELGARHSSPDGPCLFLNLRPERRSSFIYGCLAKV